MEQQKYQKTAERFMYAVSFMIVSFACTINAMLHYIDEYHAYQSCELYYWQKWMNVFMESTWLQIGWTIIILIVMVIFVIFSIKSIKEGKLLFQAADQKIQLSMWKLIIPLIIAVFGLAYIVATLTIWLVF